MVSTCVRQLLSIICRAAYIKKFLFDYNHVHVNKKKKMTFVFLYCLFKDNCPSDVFLVLLPSIINSFKMILCTLIVTLKKQKQKSI